MNVKREAGFKEEEEKLAGTHDSCCCETDPFFSTEFSNPAAIEYDRKTPERRTFVFYCDSNAPYQKGSEALKLLGCNKIPPQNVTLSKAVFKR